MNLAANNTFLPENLSSTVILDVNSEQIKALTASLIEPDQSGRAFTQKAHLHLCQMLCAIYSANEWQPASETLRKQRGSCSQRMACLEALARAAGIPTRVRALHVKRSFWYPRFPVLRYFMPNRILLLWPQFFLEGTWVGFDELHSPVQVLAESSAGFRNDGESLFEAVQKTPVDFFGKTCGLACATEGHDLSKYVLTDEGIFETRDQAFLRFGSFQYTLRGRLFELLFGGRAYRRM